MRKLKEVARLSLELNLGVRPIARACNISPSTASVYVEKLKQLGTTYEELCAMDEESLAHLLFPKNREDLKLCRSSKLTHLSSEKVTHL